MSRSSTGLSIGVASFLAYLFGWISGLVLLLLERDSTVVRRHAAQSVVIFGALTLLNLALPTVPLLGPLVAGLLRPISVLLWLALLAMVLLGRPVDITVLSPFVQRVEQLIRPRA
jgi:uncharacterized membrane protein